jgi:ribosomal protein L5
LEVAALTGTTGKGTVGTGIMIMVIDMTDVMTMIDGMSADMIVVTMTRGMNVIAIVTIETTDRSERSLQA